MGGEGRGSAKEEEEEGGGAFQQPKSSAARILGRSVCRLPADTWGKCGVCSLGLCSFATALTRRCHCKARRKVPAELARVHKGLSRKLETAVPPRTRSSQARAPTCDELVSPASWPLLPSVPRAA
eukprot:662922-Prymnesium_polylepis.1